MYDFGLTLTLTLTFDLVSRILVSVAHLLYYIRYESHIELIDLPCNGRVSRIYGCIMGGGVSHNFLCPQTSFLENMCLEKISYISCGRNLKCGV